MYKISNALSVLRIKDISASFQLYLCSWSKHSVSITEGLKKHKYKTRSGIFHPLFGHYIESKARRQNDTERAENLIGKARLDYSFVFVILSMVPYLNKCSLYQNSNLLRKKIYIYIHIMFKGHGSRSGKQELIGLPCAVIRKGNRQYSLAPLHILSCIFNFLRVSIKTNT